VNAEPSALRRYAGESAIVLGATGFIGSWVARCLAASGARLTLGVRDPGAAQDLRAELGGTADILEFDALDTAALEATMRNVRPAITFNLVGYGVDRTERDESIARRINAGFVTALCEAVSRTRDPRWPGAALVHAGTQLEYGPIAVIAEDAIPQPTTSYGRTKLEGTLALGRCAALRGLPAVTARLFTVYGPGEPASRLLPSLIETARTGADLDLTSGTQRMDFVYIGDVAEGMLRLGLARVSAGEVVNLATGTVISVRSFAEQAARALGIAPARLRFGALPQRAETMQYRAVPVDRLRMKTGWTPPMTVAAGIRETIERYGLTHVE